MKDNLDVPQGLGLLKEEEKNQLLGEVSDFGSSTLYAETGYDDEILGELFVDAEGNPLPVETYENAGRRAVRLENERIEDEGDSITVLDTIRFGALSRNLDHTL